MIAIVDETGRILGLLSERCAMPVKRRHGDTLRVWLRQPLPMVSNIIQAEAAVANIAAIEVYFRWHEVRRRGTRYVLDDDNGYISRWHLMPVREITDEQWKMDPGSLVRIKWK